MRCEFRQIGTAGAMRLVACTRCDRKPVATPHEPERVYANCNAWPRWWEWGHWAEFAFAVFGINEQRFNWLRFKLGFTTKCGCGQRIETLNASGGWLRDRLDVLGALWRTTDSPQR